MEHSILHTLLSTGLILSLGGPITVLCLLLPAARKLGIESDRDPMLCPMMESVARWVTYGALAATLGILVNFFVEVAEIQGKTVFGGVDFPLVVRFVTQTTVGRLSLTHVALLLLTACAARLGGTRKWWLVAGLASGSVVVSSLVSHASAQPQHRIVAISFQIVHIAAAAIWMGVLLHLFLARRTMLAKPSSDRISLLAEMATKFSPIALAMTSLLGITGLIAAYRYNRELGALFTSPYGLTLLVKLVLLVPAIFAGFVNFRFIRPKLLELAQAITRSSRTTSNSKEELESAKLLCWFVRTLELEVTAGMLVITVAGILGSVSPPGADGSQRLTAIQTRALLSPHLPTTDLSGFDSGPDDPRGPTISDLHFNEFSHNWSGIMVCLIGMAWMAQAVRGSIGSWAGRVLPFLLLPLGLWVGFGANPEIWLFHSVSPWQALTDPQLLVHQLSALLVFVLVWYAWWDKKNPEERRPFGYPLPTLMIAGSLLLLGHAHSTPFADELTNLVNVEHAVLGALALFGGTARLLVLRGLFPRPLARFVWPSFVIGFGLFMAFFYRETV
jgi:putative copper export protein